MSIPTPLTAGYVLLSVRTNDVHAVCRELLEMNGVILAHPLIGPDDIICFLDTQEPNNFRIVLDKGVRSLMDVGTVEHTETMLVLADEGNTYSGKENRPAPAAAWLFCDIAVGDPKPVVEQLLAIEGVVNAHPVVGRYDIVAFVEAASMSELMHILDGKIRHVRGIRRTDTRLVLMELPREKSDRGREKQKVLGTAVNRQG